MKYIIILFFSLAMLSTSAYAQDYKKHKVEKGETVMAIAKKYKVTPYDIYRLNPDSKNGIQENTVLLIPSESKSPAVAEKEQPTKVANTIHKTEAKETLYSISKKYNVSVDDIKKANGTALDSGLQIGQEVIIPIKGSSGVAAQVKTVKEGESKSIPASYFYHTVAAGETKYSIAKQYGMSLQLLEELNPEVKDNLPLGFKLKLDKNAVVEKETEPQPEPVKEQYMTYEVQPKETFYSLSKKTGLSEERITALNPDAKDGLKDGMMLKLPKGTAMSIETPASSIAGRPLSGLAASLKKNNPKEIALLLPFNMARVESDTIRAQLLRSDKFLNMTLDFYAGALMAIDSAKVLGLPLKVRILDSKESKNNSDISFLAGSLGSANAVIGPFYQNNVETTASMLSAKSIPVISPLSKDGGKSYPNLFQSIPSTERVKLAMLDYLKSKNGNAIAVVDAKKAAAKEFIRNNYSGIGFAPLNADGSLIVDALKRMLVKDKVNYVIVETERVGLLLSTTKVLVDALAEYQVQLVVLDRNDTLDNDEMAISRLTSLKMLYPSITNDSESPEAAAFAMAYKEKNGAFPNQYAIRGFDVTFDVIVRLFQEDSFKEVMDTKTTEQVENKFAYATQNGGNYNTGVYILYYDQDLSVKQAQ